MHFGHSFHLNEVKNGAIYKPGVNTYKLLKINILSIIGREWYARSFIALYFDRNEAGSSTIG